MKIPKNECEFSYSRSAGTGGQNVNKVNTKATLRWNLSTSIICKMYPGIDIRFRQQFSAYLIDDGSVVMITSQRHRSQSLNAEDCVEKLVSMLETVAHPPKIRHATRPTLASKVRRLKSKTLHSELKKARQKYK